jgi:hypothetical protein
MEESMNMNFVSIKEPKEISRSTSYHHQHKRMKQNFHDPKCASYIDNRGKGQMNGAHLQMQWNYKHAIFLLKSRQEAPPFTLHK